MNREPALRHLNTVIALLTPYTDRLEVAGSLRRGKGEVKDAELVILPQQDFHVQVWRMVTAGLLSWSTYTDKNGKTSLRQGKKYYGFQVAGLRVEVFTADPDNWGYIYWLRTGAGEANRYVMTQLYRHRCPYHFEDGYAWQQATKLTLPTEGDLFTLLGLPWIEPPQREVDTYVPLFRPNHPWGTGAVAQVTQQLTLF